MWELLSCRDLSSWQTVLVHSKPDVGTYIAVSSGILHRCTPHEPFEVSIEGKTVMGTISRKDVGQEGKVMQDKKQSCAMDRYHDYGNEPVTIAHTPCGAVA
jgi:hypothetical protein